MNKMKKALSFEGVRREFIDKINLWYGLSEKAKQMKLECGFVNSKREQHYEDEREYMAMAHALFLSGQDIGVITVNDFPQFATEEPDGLTPATP